jgi:hypothetical protein
MIKLAIGKIFLSIPTEHSEFTMDLASQFFGHSRQIVADKLDTFDVISAVTSAVGVFVYDRLEDIPFGNINELYDEYSLSLIDSEEITIIRLYNHFVWLMNKAPEVIELPIQVGNDWFWMSENAEKIMTGHIGNIEALTVGEVIELQQIKHDLSLPFQMAGHSIEISEKITAQVMGVNSAILAVLLRKKDEKLPFRISDLRAFITERSKLFNKLPYSVSAAVSFFLRNLLLASAMTNSMQITLEEGSLSIE